MMLIDGHYEMQRLKQQDMLREAELYRLARELGFTGAGVLRSIVAKLRAWLSRITSPEVTGSDDSSYARRDTAVIPTPFKDCV